MKRIFRSRKRILLFMVTFLILAGIVWQAVMVDLKSEILTAVGQSVDTGTYRAHYYSKGEGNKVFVFITGAGTPCAYTDFYSLQNELSKSGQTITYDHAGFGWSTSTKADRSINNLVKELSVIINTAAPDKRIVFVCHSLASLEAIGYTQAYPERVEGIVFLDCGSPEFYSRSSELSSKLLNRSLAFIRASGINRLLGECGILLPMYGESIRNRELDGKLKSIDKAMYYKYAGSKSSLYNIDVINENAKVVLKGERLDDTPILVLSSDSGNDWEKVQQQLALWSKDSKQVTLNKSNHYLHWSNYGEVAEYIDKFINQTLNVDSE